MTQQKKQNEEKEEMTKVIYDEESQKQPKILERLRIQKRVEIEEE